MFIFHVIYKMYCSSILKFCTQYNQCEHNGSVSVEYKIEYFDSVAFHAI